MIRHNRPDPATTWVKDYFVRSRGYHTWQLAPFIVDGSSGSDESSRARAQLFKQRLAEARSYWREMQAHAEQNSPEHELSALEFSWLATVASWKFPSGESNAVFDDLDEARATAYLDILERKAYAIPFTGGYQGFKKWFRRETEMMLRRVQSQKARFRINPPGEPVLTPQGNTPLINLEQPGEDDGDISPDGDEPETQPTIEDLAARDAFGNPAPPVETTAEYLARLIGEVRRGHSWLAAQPDAAKVEFTPQRLGPEAQKARRAFRAAQKRGVRLLGYDKDGYPRGFGGGHLGELAATEASRSDFEQTVIHELLEREDEILLLNGPTTIELPDRAVPDQLSPAQIESRGSSFEVAAMRSRVERHRLRETFRRYRYEGERGIAVVTIEKPVPPPRRWFVNEPFVPPTPTSMPLLPTDAELDRVLAAAPARLYVDPLPPATGTIWSTPKMRRSAWKNA